MVQSWDKNTFHVLFSLNPAKGPVIKASKEREENRGNWTVIGQPVSADHSRPLANEVLNTGAH